MLERTTEYSGSNPNPSDIFKHITVRIKIFLYMYNLHLISTCTCRLKTA